MTVGKKVLQLPGKPQFSERRAALFVGAVRGGCLKIPECAGIVARSENSCMFSALTTTLPKGEGGTEIPLS